LALPTSITADVFARMDIISLGSKLQLAIKLNISRKHGINMSRHLGR